MFKFLSDSHLTIVANIVKIVPIGSVLGTQ